MADIKDNYTTVLTFGLVSTIVISLAMILFIVFHDYIWITAYNIMSNLQGSGLLSGNFVSVFNKFIEGASSFLTAIDTIWFIAFLGMVFTLVRSSYVASRDGYFKLYGFLAFGVMFFLFISSIFEIINNYFYTIFFKHILVNVVGYMRFFPFYIEHFSIINLAIVIICLIANFVDFDISNVMNRKQTEVQQFEKETEI